MSDWISVKDRLPELDQVVAVCFPFNGSATYAWGARLDDTEGWLWGIHQGYGGVTPGKDASWNSVEADDDYPVQFWKPLDEPPALAPTAGER